MTATDFCGVYVAMVAGLAHAYLILARLASRRAELEQAILEELKVARFDTIRLASFIAYRQGRQHPIGRGRIRRAVRTLVRQGKVRAYEHGTAPGYRGRTFVQLTAWSTVVRQEA